MYFPLWVFVSLLLRHYPSYNSFQQMAGLGAWLQQALEYGGSFVFPRLRGTQPTSPVALMGTCVPHTAGSSPWRHRRLLAQAFDSYGSWVPQTLSCPDWYSLGQWMASCPAGLGAGLGEEEMIEKEGQWRS